MSTRVNNAGWFVMSQSGKFGHFRVRFLFVCYGDAWSSFDLRSVVFYKLINLKVLFCTLGNVSHALLFLHRSSAVSSFL